MSLTDNSNLNQSLLPAAAPEQKQYPLRKLAVAFSVTFPFILISIEIAKQTIIVGTVMSLEANPSIFRIGWVFYAQHFVELFDPQKMMKHIAHDLTVEGMAPPEVLPEWSFKKKLVAAFIIVAFTLPLGFTRIGLNQNSTSTEIFEKLPYLLVYSIIDALPHVNHLPYWHLAFNKFCSSPRYIRAWIILLMVAHALNDVADVWNTAGFIQYWVYLGFLVEFLTPGVEVVAHYKPRRTELTLISLLKFTIILNGAINIAIFNWYNTFHNLDFIMNSNSKIIFAVLESIIAVFFTFEVWNHDSASHHEHEHEHHHNHAQCLEQYPADIENGASAQKKSSNSLAAHPSTIFCGTQLTISACGKPDCTC